MDHLCLYVCVSMCMFVCLSVYLFVGEGVSTLISSTEAMLLDSIRSFSMVMGSLLLRTSWISSRER